MKYPCLFMIFVRMLPLVACSWLNENSAARPIPIAEATLEVAIARSHAPGNLVLALNVPDWIGLPQFDQASVYRSILQHCKTVQGVEFLRLIEPVYPADAINIAIAITPSIVLIRDGTVQSVFTDDFETASITNWLLHTLQKNAPDSIDRMKLEDGPLRSAYLVFRDLLTAREEATFGRAFAWYWVRCHSGVFANQERVFRLLEETLESSRSQFGRIPESIYELRDAHTPGPTTSPSRLYSWLRLNLMLDDSAPSLTWLESQDSSLQHLAMNAALYGLISDICLNNDRFDLYAMLYPFPFASIRDHYSSMTSIIGHALGDPDNELASDVLLVAQAVFVKHCASLYIAELLAAREDEASCIIEYIWRLTGPAVLAVVVREALVQGFAGKQDERWVLRLVTGGYSPPDLLSGWQAASKR